MTGRKQDAIWNKFERIKSGKGYKAVCNTCKQSMQGLVERMKAHVRNCRGSSSAAAAADHSHDTDDIEVIEQQQPSQSETAAPTTSTDYEPPRVGSGKRQRTSLSSFVVKTTRSEKEELDIAVSVDAVFDSSGSLHISL